jgi:hypothetical protein
MVAVNRTKPWPWGAVLSAVRPLGGHGRIPHATSVNATSSGVRLVASGVGSFHAAGVELPGAPPAHTPLRPTRAVRKNNAHMPPSPLGVNTRAAAVGSGAAGKRRCAERHTGED